MWHDSAIDRNYHEAIEHRYTMYIDYVPRTAAEIVDEDTWVESAGSADLVQIRSTSYILPSYTAS